MNIKSLLLGSAAALVAVSGARAADAIVVAEPEPAEYVRICDVYGAGFYYIPGTETCLKVGGYLRYDIGVGAFGHQDVVDKEEFAEWDAGLRPDYGTHDTYSKLMRAQINLDARSETEYGTLRAYMAINFNHSTARFAINDDEGYTYTTNNWNIDHAIIQLGGLTIAYTYSLFETLTDSAGTVVNDDIVAYSPGNTHLIAYTFDAGNGFSATLGVEEGSTFVNPNTVLGVVGGGSLPADGALDSYVPHVVAGASFTQGWGKISGVVAYDSVWEEVSGKVRVDVNVNDALTLWVMGGYTSADWKKGEDSYYAPWGGDWAVWGGGQYRFNEKVALDVQLSYDDSETFGAVVGARYDIVPGFVIRPEVAYIDNDGDDDWGGYIRFQRSF
ncbi:porin [Aquamicrobium terrae]|uniref:Porin n=1 Tax=Aquamicrobium terrae TaxID=1324945 RepID=A0ABV2N1W3_9HYPH